MLVCEIFLLNESMIPFHVPQICVPGQCQLIVKDVKPINEMWHFVVRPVNEEMDSFLILEKRGTYKEK